MLFMQWGLVLASLIIITIMTQQYHDKIRTLLKIENKVTLPKDEPDPAEKSSDEIRKLYFSIGKAQALYGGVSIIILLFGFLMKPTNSFILNTILLSFNGLIILSLTGYLIEGLNLMTSPFCDPNEEVGESDGNEYSESGK